MGRRHVAPVARAVAPSRVGPRARARSEHARRSGERAAERPVYAESHTTPHKREASAWLAPNQVRRWQTTWRGRGPSAGADQP